MSSSDDVISIMEVSSSPPGLCLFSSSDVVAPVTRQQLSFSLSLGAHDDIYVLHIHDELETSSPCEDVM